jgi:hypothetical protein
MVQIPESRSLPALRASVIACRQNLSTKCDQRPAAWVAGITSAGRLSRAGLNSTGLEVLHSSHQCRCALSRRFLAPQ